MIRVNNRILVLIIFIAFSIILFFCFRILAGILFEKINNASIISDQIMGKIRFSIVFIGLFILFLIIISFFGKRFGHRIRRIDLKKGFHYALIYCISLMILYIIVVFYIYIF